MDITRDQTCSKVKKWQHLIEGNDQAKTFDGVPIEQDNESKRNEKMVDEIMLRAPVRK
jgi:small subunit ribosomal protein S3Ae